MLWDCEQRAYFSVSQKRGQLEYPFQRRYVFLCVEAQEVDARSNGHTKMLPKNTAVVTSMDDATTISMHRTKQRDALNNQKIRTEKITRHVVG